MEQASAHAKSRGVPIKLLCFKEKMVIPLGFEPRTL